MFICVLFLILLFVSSIPAIGEGDDSKGHLIKKVITEFSQSNRLILWKHLLGITDPSFDSKSAVDWWESFVTVYANRVHGSPNNLQAAAFLNSELTESGYSVRVLEYFSNIGPVRVIEGTRKGMLYPNRSMGLLAHYDGHPNTIQGAYDDGSGVAITLSLCKLLAKVQTNKTITCLFFDAEEKGLMASKKYVQDVVVRDNPKFHFDQVFSYDMVGLIQPEEPEGNLYLLMGFAGSDLHPYLSRNLEFLTTIIHSLPKLGIKTNTLRLEGRNHRNSDERSFELAGVPVVRFAGGRTTSLYDGYHRPIDTIDRVYELAGGRSSFEAGFEQAVLVSYYTILAYDHYDPKNIPTQ